MISVLIAVLAAPRSSMLEGMLNSEVRVCVLKLFDVLDVSSLLKLCSGAGELFDASGASKKLVEKVAE